MELPVEEVPSRVLLLGEGFDGFRQGGHSGFCVVEGSCVRRSCFFADAVHAVAVIFGCDERAGLAEQNGVYKGGLVAESGVVEHLDASVDDAFGFSEARTDGGEPSGDLIVNVRVADHERFKRNSDDLYLVSDISIAQAALGCEIEVEGIMPDEVVKVCVPAGTQYGDTVSVNNFGMPRIGGGGSRGRLVVQLRVVVPTNLSNKQRELLRAFADEMGDDVASGKKSVTDRIKSALDDILD